LIDTAIAEKFFYFRRLLTALFPVEAFHKETETFFMHGIKDPLFLHKGLVDNTKTISPMIPFVEIKGELVLDIRAMKRLRLLPKYFQDAYTNKTFPSLWCDLSQYDHMTKQRGLQLSKNAIEKFLQDSYPNNNIHIIRAHQHNEETMPEIIDKTVKGEEAYLNKCPLVATAPAAMPWTGNRWKNFIQNKNLHPYLLHIGYYNDNHKNCEHKSEDCCENKWTAVQIYSDKEMNHVQVKSKKK
jgi:hypothetical protein